MGLQGSVRFVDSMPAEQLVDTYSKSHVFILPSKCEPWGLVAAEAMCVGLPAIVSKRCGCAADLVTEETGWLFDPYSQEDLTQVLHQVAATPIDKIALMGQKARQLAAKYSPANSADLIISSVSLATQSSQR